MISNKIAKKIFLSLLIVGTSLFSMASTYYISNTGNDANSGLSTALPWKTLAKVNAAYFRAGDQILFQKGSTFYGTITVKYSGVAGSPITYGAYGTGDNPVITGFTTVTAWTNLGSNIWESTAAVSTFSFLNVVMVNGVNTPMGRTPDFGTYYTYQTFNGDVSITSSALTGTPNWTGAEVVITKSGFTWNAATVTSQSGSTVYYTLKSANGYPGMQQNNAKFFFQADAKCLTVQNEWYYNPTTKKLKVYSASEPVNVQVPTIDYIGNYYMKHYIVFDGLHLTGANTGALNLNECNYNAVKNCVIDNIGLYGLMSYNTISLLVDNNTVSNSYIAINQGGQSSSNCIITNNTVTNIGMVPGVNSTSYSSSAITTTGNNTLAQYNSIDYCGYNGIIVLGATATIKNNFINHSIQNLDDGGGIYTSGEKTAILIDGNIVLNSKYTGIYCDMPSTNITITNNTCAGNRLYGISNSSMNAYNLIQNNVCYNNALAQIGVKNLFNVYGGTHDVTLLDNIFVSKAGQWVCHFQSQYANDVQNFIINSNYNVWARPIDDFSGGLPVNIYQPSIAGGGVFRNFAFLQTFFGKDVNSTKSPKAISSDNDLQFEYNATKVARTVTLSQPMINMKGTKYASSVTLQPYTSVVLMKDYNATKSSTEYKSICDGLSYNGWTTTGKYVRTLVAKSGIDSIVTTFLTVNPKYSIQENVTINSGETYQGWNSSGTYSRTLNSISGCDSIVTTYLTVSAIKVGETMIQTIALKKGNNMISTYLQAANPDISVITKTIRDSGYLIKMQNESGNSYENWGTLGGWTNNLGSIQNTEGYKITVANDCVLQVTGTQIGLPLNISLNVGWNIISFPRTDILDAKMIVQSLIDQSALVKVQDEIGNSIEDWGVFGGWKNGIGNFLPGKAYRVKVSKIAVLTIQDIYPKSVAIPVYAEQTQYFNSIVEGNGFDHMNINLVGLSESGLSSGDELAAFDGTICVGTLKITDQHMMEGSASLIASCSTGNLQKDGFTEGSSIQLQIWNQISGEASGIQFSILRGSSTYLKNATMLGKLKSLTTSVSNFAEETQIEVYPNPSQGRFTVRYSELPASGSRIDVLDISGRKIASRLITGISEEFDLFGQAAGLYLVKSILGVKENIDKLIIQY